MNLLNIKFRPVMINEGVQFISLMNKTYLRKKTLEYFKWQYFDTPLRTVLMGAFLKEKLVGCFGLQCRELNNGLIGGQAIDLIVDDKFRGQGIFKKLAKKTLNLFGKSLDFGFVLPNIAGKKAMEKSLDWVNILTIRTMMLKDFSQQYNNGLGKIIKNWDNILTENNKKNQSRVVYFIRNSEDLKWRFDKNPEHKYSIIKINSAFVITKIFIDPITEEYFGDIVDFGCNMEDKLLLKKLFSKGVDHLKQQGIKKITTWAMPNTALYKILEEIGFIESNQERYFCLKTFKSNYKYLYDISNWLLVEGDAEIY